MSVLAWYESRFDETFGSDEEPMHTVGRVLYYASIATWMAPFFMVTFVLMDVIDEFMDALLNRP
ncbi:hypothetical protein RitSun_46 [Mycobacterium phage RitSun]|nr:hypothetical protein SEA_FRANKIE_43 [Mycobacterium phage Frankie]QXG07416.1 hypothetical protein RitSun_46 [Mycobacterium phage RitSun]